MKVLEILGILTPQTIATKKADVSAAGQLMKMMTEFIEEVNKD